MKYLLQNSRLRKKLVSSLPFDVFVQIPDGEKFIQAAGGGVHPSYNSNNLDYDFVLIKLASPVTISANVSLACLPPDVAQV